MSTAYLSRVLQMLCQPLQGQYSTGAATVRATSTTTVLEPGDVLVPILNDCEAEESAVKIEPNPDTTDHAWSVTTAGTPVVITSLQGGAHVDLPVGTTLRFDDPSTGIEELAAVSTSMTGGTRLENFGALRQVRAYKDLGSKLEAEDFFAAQVGEYPAAVLVWNATTPGDGSSTPSVGVDSTRLGMGRSIYTHEFHLFIVSARLDSSDRRKREGDVIRDRILKMLTSRSSFRKVQVSYVNPIKVTDARLAKAGPTAYVDAIRFACYFVLRRADERTFNDWLTAKLDVTRPTSVGGVAVDKLTVEDNRIDMSDGD